MYLLDVHLPGSLLSVCSSRFARSASKQSDEHTEFYCVREWRLSLGRPCLTRAIVVCTRSLKILLTKSPWAGKPNVCSTPPAFSFVNNCVIYIPLYTLGKYGGCHTAVSLITRVRRVRDRPTDLGPPAVRPLHHRPTDLGGGVRDLGRQLSKTPERWRPAFRFCSY